MRIDIITCCPELLESPLNHSIIQRAKNKGLCEIYVHNLRDWTLDKHRKVDDYAFGFGAGMVLQIEPIDRLITHLTSERRYDEIIFTAPDGARFDQKAANELSLKENIIILHSDKYQHVRILLPHLMQLQQEGYRLRIVSQYSWEQERIGLPTVHTSVFTAASDREAYDAQWANYFEPEHASDAPRFDLLGYDLTRALVAWLQGKQTIQGLQADIRWQQIEEGGYQNVGVKVIEK